MSVRFPAVLQFLALMIVAVLCSSVTARRQFDIDNPLLRVGYDTFDEYDDDEFVDTLKRADEYNQRPVLTFWKNILKGSPIRNLNITNPFTRLFSPYVIKVDFPPGTDPNLADDMKFMEVAPRPVSPIKATSQATKTHYFYDPVTQEVFSTQDRSQKNPIIVILNRGGYE